MYRISILSILKKILSILSLPLFLLPDTPFAILYPFRWASIFQKVV